MCPEEYCTFACRFRLTFVEEVVKLSSRYLRFGCGVPTLDSRPLQPDRSYQKDRLSNEIRRHKSFQVSLRHSWRFGANDAVFCFSFCFDSLRAGTNPALSVHFSTGTADSIERFKEGTKNKPNPFPLNCGEKVEVYELGTTEENSDAIWWNLRALRSISSRAHAPFDLCEIRRRVTYRHRAHLPSVSWGVPSAPYIQTIGTAASYSRHPQEKARQVKQSKEAKQSLEANGARSEKGITQIRAIQSIANIPPSQLLACGGVS